MNRIYNEAKNKFNNDKSYNDDGYNNNESYDNNRTYNKNQNYNKNTGHNNRYNFQSPSNPENTSPTACDDPQYRENYIDDYRVKNNYNDNNYNETKPSFDKWNKIDFPRNNNRNTTTNRDEYSHDMRQSYMYDYNSNSNISQISHNNKLDSLPTSNNDNMENKHYNSRNYNKISIHRMGHDYDRYLNQNAYFSNDKKNFTGM